MLSVDIGLFLIISLNMYPSTQGIIGTNRMVWPNHRLDFNFQTASLDIIYYTRFLNILM